MQQVKTIPQLDDIASGNLSAADARTLLATTVLDAPTVRRVCTVLRAWTWKALDEKRRDAELRQWHDLMARMHARLKDDVASAARIKVLQELIHESVAVGEKRSASEVLKRRHARDMLMVLHKSPDSSMPRSALMKRLKLKPANLSRLQNMLLSAGLIERIVEGREATFRLSRQGMEEVAKLPVAANASWTTNFDLAQLDNLITAMAETAMVPASKAGELKLKKFLVLGLLPKKASGVELKTERILDAVRLGRYHAPMTIVEGSNTKTFEDRIEVHSWLNTPNDERMEMAHG